MGQRRVGKSYILKSIARLISNHNPNANIISLNLEDFAFNHVKDAQSLYNEISARINVIAEEEWAKNLPNRKHGEPKPKKLNKSDLDYADDCYFAGLENKI